MKHDGKRDEALITARNRIEELEALVAKQNTANTKDDVR